MNVTIRCARTSFVSHCSSSAGGSGRWDDGAMRHLRNSCAAAARAAAFLKPGAVRGEIHRPLQHIARVLLEMAIAGHGQHVGVLTELQNNPNTLLPKV